MGVEWEGYGRYYLRDMEEVRERRRRGMGEVWERYGTGREKVRDPSSISTNFGVVRNP